MYSALQDKNPMSTNFKVPPGLSSVDIIDFSLSRFVNFQSEITFPEEGGILQVENFGMHINVDGTVLQGMKIEAVMDRRADNISLDLLSRVLVDHVCVYVSIYTSIYLHIYVCICIYIYI